MDRGVLFAAGLILALALYVWAQVADQVLPGTPLGLANDASTVQQEVDGPPDVETHWY